MDGYRVDAARHVEKQFWPEFGQAAKGPFLLGEVNVEASRTEYLASYQDVLPGLLNFATHDVLSGVFHSFLPMTALKANLDLQRSSFSDLSLTTSFVDSHDVQRFMHRTKDADTLKSALALVLFGDGIPVVYAGTELAFEGGSDPLNRESMWPKIDSEPEKQGIHRFIKRSLDVRKGLATQGVIQSHLSVDKMVDSRTYAFARGAASQLVVVITNQVVICDVEFVSNSN